MLKVLTASLLAALTLVPPALADGGGKQADARFATFNASLNRNAAGQLVADLARPTTSRRGMQPRRSSASGPTSS